MVPLPRTSRRRRPRQWWWIDNLAYSGAARSSTSLWYFIRNPLFAQIWSHYRLSAEWDRYRVYIRKD